MDLFHQEIISIGNGQLDSVYVNNTYWSLPVDPVFYSSCDYHCSGVYPTPFYFNGDDAITLEKDGNIIDIFGKVGEDPGSAWTRRYIIRIYRREWRKLDYKI